MGVSADTPDTQLKFVEKFGLEFPVIPNPDKNIIEAWGARGVMGLVAQRSTFLVDPDGRVAHVWPKVTVEGHGDDVLETLTTLSSATAR